MRFPPAAVLVLSAALTGCATFDAEDFAGTAAERVGDVADRVLADTEAVLCSKRFSLRAYAQAYGARWDDLVTFCQWDQRTPRPPEEVRPWK